MKSAICLALALPIALSAQLIPVGQPIPTGPHPPVVFLNGYQLDCSSSSFSGTFGMADTVLQASQIVTLFFDNCSVPNKPAIETLGAAFGQFLAALKYTDGTPVTQVDVVAHSMGGLIVRNYLSGKQARGTTVFQPPASPGIRKIVFLGTPHFGTSVASAFGTDDQTSEMSPGSQFLFNLNTWNDGTDDLRGLDVLSVAGNGGTGAESSIPGFDDGVVTLTSASIGFARPGRTRVITACHANISLLSTFGYCKSGVPFIADVTDASNLTGQILTSFLTNTTAWQSIGTAIEANSIAANLGGINIEAQDLNGVAQSISSASIATPQGKLNLSLNGDVAYSEGLIPNMNLVATVQANGQTLSPTVNLPATTVAPVTAKPGPVISRVLPAAGATFPLNAAPGQFLTIYGSNLTATTLSTPTLTYPTQLADVQVLVNGTPAPIDYISPSQINFVNTSVTSGLTQITVTSTNGQQTANILITAAVPAVFSLDASGTGPGAVINGITGQVIGASTPLHAGDYASIFLSGLGQTTTQNGFQIAQIAPTVTIGGQNCVVTYAGTAPTEEGVDQINCQVPTGITPGATIPLVVTSNGRASNSVTVAVQ